MFYKGPDGITRYSPQEDLAPAGLANAPYAKGVWASVRPSLEPEARSVFATQDIQSRAAKILFAEIHLVASFLAASS